MKKWLKNRNILKYVIRQAQSCDYLENYFNKDLRGDLDEDGQRLLDQLIYCHRRQKGDILSIIGYIPERKGGSYYFDKMKEGTINTLCLLSIQYVSYLRGKKRYSLLMKYDAEENNEFRELWKKFHSDAQNNANITLEYLLKRWGIKAMYMILYLQIKEQLLIWKINKYGYR